MNRLDALIEKGANRLQEFANQTAANGGGGVKAKLAQELADDAAFLRKLKPSLIVARARGQAPTDQKPAEGVLEPTAPPRPEPEGREPEPPRRGGGGRGPNPLLVVGIAFAAGIVLAKVIDWRSHGHPRR
jgi:hypothetical protein